jgi:hypothetical protein
MSRHRHGKGISLIGRWRASEGAEDVELVIAAGNWYLRLESESESPCGRLEKRNNRGGRPELGATPTHRCHSVGRDSALPVAREEQFMFTVRSSNRRFGHRTRGL